MNAQPPQLTSSVRKSSVGTETILVVEDDDLIRKMTVDAISGSGYKVLEAANPGEALRRVGEYEASIDLVLTDVVMPKMSGTELINQLMKLRPKIKYVYMSGYTNEALSNHMSMDEGFEFLEKPFTT